MLPFFVSDVPLHCINEAAIEYHVPAKLIISILNVERGKIGMSCKNKNGTYDIGPAQINSSWLPELEKHGITQYDVQYNACLNVKIGTWILSKKISNRSNLLEGIGDYNSHTQKINQAYSQKVRINFTKYQMYLSA